MNNNRNDPESGNTRPPNPAVQRLVNVPLPIVLVFLILLFMLLNHNSDEFLAKHRYKEALATLEWQHSNLTTWLNGNETSLTLHEQNPIMFPILHSFGLQKGMVDTSEASYYPNITGFIHGNVDTFNITPPALQQHQNHTWAKDIGYLMANTNLTETIEQSTSWNWAASKKITMSLMEKSPPDDDEFKGSINVETALVHGRVEFSEDNSNESLRLEFEGIHFLSNGSLYGFAELPGRSIDIRMLATIVPPHVKNMTAQILKPEMEARIRRLNEYIDAGVIETEPSDLGVETSCGFEVYAQIEPVMIPLSQVAEIEEELQNPTGILSMDLPRMSLNGILISKECGILFELKDAVGMRSRKFFRKITTYAGTAAIAYFIMLMYFVRQVDVSRTPSGLSNLSKWTFLSQATVDAVSFAGYITFAILAEGRPSLSLVAPAFMGGLLFIQQAKFALQMQRFQVPEAVPQPATPTPAPPPAPSPPLVPDVPQVQDGSNPPTEVTPTSQATTPRTTPPPQEAFLPFLIHHVRTDPQARLYVSMLIFLSVVVRVILSPILSLMFVAITYSAFWLPQIIRSAVRVRSSGLKHEYVIAVTVCRLYFLLYFLTCPENVIEIKPRRWPWLLALFVSLQAIVVMLQQQFGPAFFLPQQYTASKVYDYHPPMPLPDSESPEKSLGDCSICMDAIIMDPFSRRRSQDGRQEISTAPSSNDGKSSGTIFSTRENAVSRAAGDLINAVQNHVGAASARKEYSLAPCHHLFHTDCLEQWLAIKNICPQCRRPLPPL